MKLEHSFSVPASVEDAWTTLVDIERVAPCMPGATLETVEGDEFTGSVKVKLGPIGLTYKGKAQWLEKDDVAHRAVIRAQGKDARGNSTAAATITTSLQPIGDGGGTKVDVLTDLDITGKPAQFGRGVMVDVGNKLIGQFADCLAGKMGVADAAPAESSTAPVGASAPTETPVAEPEVAKPAEPAKTEVKEAEAIDLLSAAGPAVAKRLIPVVAVVVVLAVIIAVWVASRAARRPA